MNQFVFIATLRRPSIPEGEPGREPVSVFRVEAPGLPHARLWGVIAVKDYCEKEGGLDLVESDILRPGSWPEELGPVEKLPLVEFDVEAFTELGIREYEAAYGEDGERRFIEDFGEGVPFDAGRWEDTSDE